MMIPERLAVGDTVRVVAPSCSLAMIGPETRAIARERFTALGLHLTFGDHVEEADQFVSSSIKHRVHDLHDAFTDPEVKAIVSVIGGYNSNQLLPYLDWDLIGAHPKILCGYSDITALSCAIHASTGMVTYSGPHFSTFGMQHHLDQTLAWFRDVMFGLGDGSLRPAATWSDDAWYDDQDNRTIVENDGHWVLRGGEASGPLIGGNLCTLNLLQGTGYMPSLDGAILFVEDDYESDPHTFDRDLTSLTQQRDFAGVQGLLIGRFQRQVGMARPVLEAIIASKQELVSMPIVANLDFGHTDPLMTLPVGGAARISAEAEPDTTSLTLG